MEAMQVRARFHELIDRIEDTDRLKTIFDALADADQLPAEVTDELIDEQRQRLELSLEQVKTGEVVRHQDVKKTISRWLK
ncbi:hypothetical protein GCM10023189_01900 [Nibrella saemangeumensis]|uniref:Addiction module component n=1 Tax=Nibrella saemangeumensis TaxID=1084526 RepID=A0ABP8M9Q2_9BACT